MFLKVYLFAIILNCVVLASCEESSLEEIYFMQETIPESDNESKSDGNVDLSTIDNLEITNALNESESTINIASDVSTAATFIETEDNASEINDMTIGTTGVDNNEKDSSTYNSADVTDIEGHTIAEDLIETSTVKASETSEVVTKESTVNITEEPTANITEEPTVNITEESTANITEEPTVNITDDVTTNITEEPTVNITEEPTVYIPEEATVNNTVETADTVTKEPSTESTVTEDVVTETTTTTTTTTTTEVPTTPIDILCPQIPETAIDPKYRNETFDLYFEDFMKKNPLAKIFKSPGFPAPYADNLNCTLSVTLTNCTGIDVVVHYLDLNPFTPDTLNIRGVEEDETNEMGKKLTGRQYGVTFKIIHTTSLYIWFSSSFNEEYQGFLLTYSPYGNDTLPPTTTEAPITIPPSEVQVYEVQLVVPGSSKTNVTWNKFKEVLASSASKYVTDQNLNYVLAHPDNVTVDIYNCSNNWPNYEDCVRLQFSISLWRLNYDPDVDFDLGIFEYELSTNSLSIMWDLYGREEFSQVLGVEEYYIPDGTYILLLWTGVSLTIIVIFIGILYSIWRIDIFREYRRMHSKSDDQQDILKNKSEMDLSMYSIPHQPYPTLFETNEMNSGGYYDSYEINSTSFQGHNFQEKPSNNYRNANDHFSPNIIDFNDTQLFPDDEEDFGRGTIEAQTSLNGSQKRRVEHLNLLQLKFTTKFIFVKKWNQIGYPCLVCCLFAFRQP